MAFNPNEMIIDRVRYVTFNDLKTGEQQFMLTQLEDPSLNCTAEGEDVVDAVGALITTLYRSKQAEFTASNSLFSLNLAAAQLGSQKEVASAESKIEVYKYQFIDVPAEATSVTLAETPVANSVQYIYAVENGVSTDSYKAGSTASATEFKIEGKEITLPTLGDGKKLDKIFVEYKYESENAVRVVNSASDFPEVGTAHIYVIFKDVCTEEVIAGQIIFNKAKLDPSSVELALTATGKHAFTLKAFKDYCSEDEELYTIIVTQ